MEAFRHLLLRETGVQSRRPQALDKNPVVVDVTVSFQAWQTLPLSTNHMDGEIADNPGYF
jgi:hypothetical protein